MSVPIVQRASSGRPRLLLAVVVLVVVWSLVDRTAVTPDLPALLQEHAPDSFDEEESKDEIEESEATDKESQESPHRVADLDCAAYGGPDREAAQEMVYWRDIPADASFRSGLASSVQEPRYLTFESDEGGFNNIRMGLETAVTMALAMGRILVLPPEQNFYLLWDDGGKKQQKKSFGFDTFYHIESIAREHAHMRILSFEEFLQTEAMTGRLRDPSGHVSFPPDNRTDWNGRITNFMTTRGGPSSRLYPWIRNVTTPIDWNYGQCVAAFPQSPGPQGLQRLRTAIQDALVADQNLTSIGNVPSWQWRLRSYENHPTPVDAPIDQRLAELLTNREQLCLYDEPLQQARVVHLKGEERSGARMLVHFYAFLFFEDYQQDLWTKRFVRDHMRYQDEIQCAAARIVQELRLRARANGGNADGAFGTAHIRRGDFQYKEQKMSAEQIYADNMAKWFTENQTLYIATDEKDASYFDPIRQHYNVYFLSDFAHLIEGVNTNFYGMIDQLVAAKGDKFMGAYFSTFTGFINRIRGYHAQKRRLPGYDMGIVESMYYTSPKLARYRRIMLRYRAVKPPFWASEFPVGWRDIDHDATPTDQ